MLLDSLKLFDAYGLKAQLFPAIIAGLPTLSLVLVLVPWDHLGLPHALASVMIAVLLYAFADLARRYGRKVEAKLGTRSTPELLFRSNALIDEPSKVRYRAFLAKKVGTTAPTKNDEISNSETANQFYNSAATWLRENTRDTKKFKLLFNELCTYGFRRNLLGLKYISLSLNITVFAVCIALLYFRWTYFATLPDIEAKLWIVIVVGLFHSLFMIFGVNKTAVIEASKTYGRQLILSCDAIIGPRQPTAERSGKRQIGHGGEDGQPSQ